jgi:hypothetical protein
MTLFAWLAILLLVSFYFNIMSLVDNFRNYIAREWFCEALGMRNTSSYIPLPTRVDPNFYKEYTEPFQNKLQEAAKDMDEKLEVYRLQYESDPEAVDLTKKWADKAAVHYKKLFRVARIYRIPWTGPKIGLRAVDRSA